MNHSFLKTSRLTIIFIIAVALSGSTLTYFSINNISNQKELTEKKIIEEERVLSGRISASLLNLLNNVTEGLAGGSRIPGILKDSLLIKIAGREFIQQSFILNNDGIFLYPSFAGIPEMLKTSGPSGRFSITFRSGEEAEFTGNNPGKAREFYLSCLDLAAGAVDSARALNALGRVALKLNDTNRAVICYRLLVSDFPDVPDLNGVPYVYYALPRLMVVTPVVNLEKTVPLVEISLGKIVNGSIPLNFNTEDLLQQVKGWSEANITNRTQLSKIDSLISLLNRQIRFVQTYRAELQELAKKGNRNEQSEGIGDFRIYDPFSGEPGEFFMVSNQTGYTMGYLINVRKLFESILNKDLQSAFNFEYSTEFTDQDNPSERGNPLAFVTPLTPLFPGQMVTIKLKDESLIKKIVQRRSWIYGISSVLLLIAMLLGVILILRDVAREKHLARLRSDFISNVTHELKTPLTSIRMYAESLLMDRVKTASGRKEYLTVVVNESERLKRMINNILEFSKMEKAKQELHLVKYNLSALLHSAINDLKYWLEEKQFSLTTEIDPDINAKVDPEKFRQVFTNLLSNAIKYSGESRKIIVRLFKKVEEVIIEFEDEGIGINPDDQTKIFEPFYRVEQQESGEITGTGLGLTVVKEIVEAHNGEISVTSVIGKGSKFTVTLRGGGN